MKEKIITYVQSHQPEMVSLLEQLVNIDSGSYTLSGVESAAGVIIEQLQQSGFQVKRLPSETYTPHILATKRGSGKGKVMFLCHMDTVFPEGTAAKRPFHTEGDKAYGPGVCDMKAGIVCMLAVFKALDFAGFANYEELKVLINSDEERGSATSEPYIIQECRKSDMVLVMEAGMPGNYVVIERQGGGILNMDITGVPAHAGANPLDGVHAIDEAAQKILAMHALTDYEKGKSISVGVIRGGERSNIIPEHVFMEIDLRNRLHTDGLDLLEKMQSIADKSFVPGTKSTLKTVMYRPPIERTAGNQAMFEKLQAAALQLGQQVYERYSGGGSDGNYTSAEGIPTIDSLGPIGDLEHTDDEYIFLPTLFSRTELVALFLTELTG